MGGARRWRRRGRVEEASRQVSVIKIYIKFSLSARATENSLFMGQGQKLLSLILKSWASLFRFLNTSLVCFGKIRKISLFTLSLFYYIRVIPSFPFSRKSILIKVDPLFCSLFKEQFTLPLFVKSKGADALCSFFVKSEGASCLFFL